MLPAEVRKDPNRNRQGKKKSNWRNKLLLINLEARKEWKNKARPSQRRRLGRD